MKVKDIMTGFTPNEKFEGFATNDDYVLAVNISGNKETAESEYVVAQMGISGLDSQMNPVTEDKQYIRSGQSTTKTGTQRTFAITGDRYIGDEFQDYCLSHGIRYGTGSKVVVQYIYFNVLTGKGEKGEASIIVNSDAAGNAGESATIDISLNKTGSAPVEYTYSEASSSSYSS